MELTTTQKKEVKDWIFCVPKYRETFNELYDHILNALKDIDAPFSTDLVDEIVLNEFGGYQMVAENEKVYRNVIGRKYMKFFNVEMLNTFKWPGLISTLSLLSLCLMFYFGGKDISFDIKNLTLSSIIICAFVLLFGLARIIINRIKYLKGSILDDYLMHIYTFGSSIVTTVVIFFLSKDSSVYTSDHAKLIITLCLFFFTSVYVRAFIKFYNQKIKVLGL